MKNKIQLLISYFVSYDTEYLGFNIQLIHCKKVKYFLNIKIFYQTLSKSSH